MSELTCRTIDSPIGPLVLAGRDGALSNLRMTNQRYPPDGQPRWREDPTAFTEAVEQLHSYFAGELTRFEVTLDLRGTQFQRRVWHALVEIPYGQTRSYRQLAERVGSPGASRAVGLANGRNPVAIIVPCHRVIGVDGSLTGYGGGLERKQALLALEGGQLAFDDRLTPR